MFTLCYHLTIFFSPRLSTFLLNTTFHEKVNLHFYFSFFDYSQKETHIFNSQTPGESGYCQSPIFESAYVVVDSYFTQVVLGAGAIQLKTGKTKIYNIIYNTEVDQKNMWLDFRYCKNTWSSFNLSNKVTQTTADLIPAW